MQYSLKRVFFNYMKEEEYKAKITLYLNFLINIVYAVFKAVCGFVFHSAWIGTLAFYYILLSSMRLLLVRGMGHTDVCRRWKKYFQCGWLLLLFTIVLVGMSILMQNGEESISYPENLIYGVAAYTFYAVVIAVWNIGKYRKINDPIYLADKMLSLAVAIVALFSLQSALISAFGDDPDFARIMGIATGSGAFVIIDFMAVRMITKGYRAARVNKNQEET